LTEPTQRGRIEHVFVQGSLFGSAALATGEPARLQRTWLDGASWVDYAPLWLTGADELFDRLVDGLPWRQRRAIPMYDQIVDEPRLVHWCSIGSDDPVGLPILGEIGRLLGEHYRVAFDSIGFNLYRNGDDSVAWHGDRHRNVVTDPIVAIVSVGAGRNLRLRPRGGGASRSWDLGYGDLFVMGGACQHDWEHAVPKARSAGPRISITFRHDAR
jgi:alkylated DNA repair dioxygenase AlkB